MSLRYTTDIFMGLVSWLKRPAPNFEKSFCGLEHEKVLDRVLHQPNISTSKNYFSLPNSVISLNHKKGGQDKSTSRKGLVLPTAVFLVQFWQTGYS